MTKRNSRTWIEHALKRSVWQPERQVAALGTLGFIIALILGALYLSQVASEAATNRELREMQAQRDDLERVNEQLRAEIAELRSVPRLEARALDLGFRPAGQQDIEWLVVEGYNPVRVDTVAPVVPPPAAEEDGPTYDETFADWLSAQWDALLRAIGGTVGGEDG